MSFFNEDPFEDIMKEFFGSHPSPKNGNRFISGEEEERTIDFIEDNDYAYLIFEIPGFTEQDCNVSIRGNELTINTNKRESQQMQPYLQQKLSHGETIRKILPRFINHKKFKHTVKNGILEIVFMKK